MVVFYMAKIGDSYRPEGGSKPPEDNFSKMVSDGIEKVRRLVEDFFPFLQTAKRAESRKIEHVYAALDKQILGHPKWNEIREGHKEVLKLKFGEARSPYEMFNVTESSVTPKSLKAAILIKFAKEENPDIRMLYQAAYDYIVEEKGWDKEPIDAAEVRGRERGTERSKDTDSQKPLASSGSGRSAETLKPYSVLDIDEAKVTQERLNETYLERCSRPETTPERKALYTAAYEQIAKEKGFDTSWIKALNALPNQKDVQYATSPYGVLDVDKTKLTQKKLEETYLERCSRPETTPERKALYTAAYEHIAKENGWDASWIKALNALPNQKDVQYVTSPYGVLDVDKTKLTQKKLEETYLERCSRPETTPERKSLYTAAYEHIAKENGWDTSWIKALNALPNQKDVQYASTPYDALDVDKTKLTQKKLEETYLERCSRPETTPERKALYTAAYNFIKKMNKWS